MEARNRHRSNPYKNVSAQPDDVEYDGERADSAKGGLHHPAGFCFIIRGNWSIEVLNLSSHADERGPTWSVSGSDTKAGASSEVGRDCTLIQKQVQDSTGC